VFFEKIQLFCLFIIVTPVTQLTSFAGLRGENGQPGMPGMYLYVCFVDLLIVNNHFRFLCNIFVIKKFWWNLTFPTHQQQRTHILQECQASMDLKVTVVMDCQECRAKKVSLL
jgi:hypothetical protein